MRKAAGGEAGRERKRFAVGHDQPLGDIFERGKRIAGNVLPGGQQAGPGVGRCGGIEQRQPQRDERRDRRHDRPQPVPRVRDRIAKIAFTTVLRHLLDGRLAQCARSRLLGVVFYQFDNAQQLVAHMRMLAA